MRVKKFLVIALSIFALAATRAWPADLAGKAPQPAPVPVSDWSGIYVGVEGGYGWGKQDLNAFFPGGVDPQSQSNFPGVAIQSGTQKGWLLGGFAGAQKQWGSWVFGVESDFDAAAIKGSPVASATTPLFLGGTGGFGPCGTGNTLCLTQTVAGVSKIDELGSLRGKVGFVLTPNLLIYGTGGLGFAHVTNTFSDTNVSQLQFNPLVVVSSVTSVGGTSVLGWAAGAGFDWKWPADAGSAWVFGVDYLHYGFGTQNINVSDNAGSSFAFHNTMSVDTVKGRISYLFSIH
jgi:outer membrane immunogenic protein